MSDFKVGDIVVLKACRETLADTVGVPGEVVKVDEIFVWVKFPAAVTARYGEWADGLCPCFPDVLTSC